MITENTAKGFGNNLNDGFVRPHMAWCATSPSHVNELGGSSISSNFWVGSPEDIKVFANKMVEFYKDFIKDNKLTSKLDDDESISVLYWEVDGLAMCANLSTTDNLFDVLPNDLLDIAYEELGLELVLGDGNDNHPGMILNNEDSDLSVEQRLKLSTLMDFESTKWVFDESYGDVLSDFNDEQIEQLRENLAK